MWGEKWGEMIWGGGSTAAVQIPFGPWTILLLGFILGVCAVYANRSRIARIVPFVMVLLVPVVAVIAFNVPHTFSNGTIADAEEVNANFQELLSGLDSLISQTQPAPSVYLATNSLASVFFEQSDLDEICGDVDGCDIRLCSLPSGIADENMSCALKRYKQNGDWYSHHEYNEVLSQIRTRNDNGITHVLIDFHSCSFSDADNLSNDDTGSAMRVYRSAGSSAQCFLRVDD